MAKFSVMEPLDNAVLQKLEELQTNKEVQKMMDAYSNLDERPQELVKAAMAIALIAVPLLIISIFYGMNSSLKSEIDDKKELLELSQNVIREKSAVGVAQSKYLGRQFVSTLNDMQNIISAAISASGIDATKVSVSNFNNLELEGLINQTTLDMKFNGLSNEELFTFIGQLSARNKVKFEEITVKKNQSDNLLEGVASLIYISKDQGGGI